MKTKTLLIAAAMLICFSAASFAQSTYNVSSTPYTTVIATGNAEPAGNITFAGTGTSVAGTITVQYGGNNTNITTNKSVITVTTAGAVGGAAALNTTATTYNPGLLVIDIPPGISPAVAGTPYTITLSKVRVQINGTGLTSLVANISATGNLIAAGSTSVTVINSTTGVGIASANTFTAPAAAAPPPPAGGSPTIPIDFVNTTPSTVIPIINQVNGTFTDGFASGRTVAIVVKEGFLQAYTQGVGVRITVSSTPPKGVSFVFPATASSFSASGATTVNANWVRGGSTSWVAAGSNMTIDSDSTSGSSLQVYYYVATDTAADPTNVEYLEIPVTINSVPGSETFPLTAKSFTYTVSLAPVRDAYDSSGVPRNVGTPAGSTSDSPRFAALETAAAPFVNIGGGNTVLFIPYGYASKKAGDFDTAMSVSNTTEDPGQANLGFNGAIMQNGPITFYLFPQNTTLPMFSYKTGATSPGSGLDTSGNIAAGGTYIVFLSQIFPLATPSTGTSTIGDTFIGYIMIVTNFTNGHGIFTISNFTTLTAQSSLMQVLSDRTVLPEK